MPWSTYTCGQCSSVFGGTIVRFVLTSAAVGLVGYVLIRVIKGKAAPVLLVPVAALAVVVLLANLPGQIRKVGTADAPGKGGPV